MFYTRTVYLWDTNHAILMLIYTAGGNQLSLTFDLFVCLDSISNRKSIVLIKCDTTFIAFSHFVNFVLEASQGVHMT